MRIGPVRSVSVGFLNEAAIRLAPRKRLVLTRKGGDADKEDAEKEDAAEAGEEHSEKRPRSHNISIICICCLWRLETEFCDFLPDYKCCFFSSRV